MLRFKPGPLLDNFEPKPYWSLSQQLSFWIFEALYSIFLLIFELFAKRFSTTVGFQKSAERSSGNLCSLQFLSRGFRKFFPFISDSSKGFLKNCLVTSESFLGFLKFCLLISESSSQWQNSTCWRQRSIKSEILELKS